MLFSFCGNAANVTSSTATLIGCKEQQRQFRINTTSVLSRTTQTNRSSLQQGLLVDVCENRENTIFFIVVPVEWPCLFVDNSFVYVKFNRLRLKSQRVEKSNK